ncbi:MAG: alpha/beta fold hydrolase [Gemmatimonadales bacterium]|nr:alpha/beta fold hydrolase [Gemmatimonadales bacterium]
MNLRLGVLIPPFLLMAGTLAAQQHCQLISVDGRAVQACVSGDGPTTVVLAAGAGQASGTWSRVVPELAGGARVITFDRPGFGGSEAGVSPRTPTRIARELRSVLEALGVEDPVVLVGHSMGGVHVLRYATLFPEDVAAIAILDSPPPGFEEERLTLLSPAEVAERGRLLERGLTNAPEAVRLEREGARSAQEWDFSAFPSGAPLLVVAADSQDFGDLGSATAHRRLWMAKSRQWLHLSERAEFLVAEGSGHMVHHDRLALVVEAVRQLLGAAGGDDSRSRSPTSDCY